MDPLSEAFQHHTWATEQLIRHLRRLPKAALTATAPGVYGEVLATLSHLIAADGDTCATWRARRRRPTGPDIVRTLDELADLLRDQAVRWRVVLARAGELDVTLPARGTGRTCRTPRTCCSPRRSTTATTIAPRSARFCRRTATRPGPGRLALLDGAALEKPR